MSKFTQLLKQRVMYFDGAMGTSIHELDLDLDKHYLGRENCTEALVLGAPDAIQGIHERMLLAGADAVETDTFNGQAHTLEDQDLQHEVRKINRVAAEIARAACEKYSTADNPRFVIGSMGPGTKLITLGNIGWDEMAASYAEQVRGLLDGGADVLLIETAQDLLQIKCVLAAVDTVLKERNLTWDQDGTGDIPVMVQVTIETMGTMLLGSDIGGATASLWDYPILSLGMNCATGPAEMAEHVQYLSKNWRGQISLLPNAGLPLLVDGQTVFPLKPQPFANKMAEYVDQFGLNIVGGCCGTVPEHIQALRETVGERAPVKRDRNPWKPSCASLMSAVEYRQDNSILNIGERTNASGSRKFKRLLEEENWDEIMSLARDMVREGSHVIDVNVDYAGRDNAQDMETIVSKLVNQVNAPLMLDSTQPATIEAGLKCAGGKCIINSANLEEGEEKFALFCDLAKRYGAGLVLGTIDEDPEEAMARTRERKLAIAERMHDLAVNKYGLASADLMFDPLVLPISTGMDKDRRSGLETIEGTRLISERFPDCQITCGLSNISFGLKPAARQVLNSVFLHELTQAGLTSAILHVSKILPQNRIPEDQWAAALDLIYDRPRAEADAVTLEDGSTTTDPLQIFVSLFPDDAATVSTKIDLSDLPLEERLQKHIIDGEKKNLEATLDEALPIYGPLGIINDHLLEGMKVVGELFGSGQMQLPFVLQSAQVMKSAVAHLEPHMEKTEGQTKGSIVLATVKGDVHDIGKNLVDIILTNNGYTVHNLGIKQPVNAIIQAYRETKADVIGLSGLLVKSVNVMDDNLAVFNDEGIDCPMILGGAALSKKYCEGTLRGKYNGHVYHGTDAFEGLRVMDLITQGKQDELNAEIEARLTKRADAEARVAASASPATAVAEAPARSAVATDNAVPAPPFWGSRLAEDIPLDTVYSYINKTALYRGQWQFRKGRKSKEDYAKYLQDEVDPIFKRLTAQCKDEGILVPKAVWGYYPCNSDGDDLVVYDAEDHDREIERFSFPRQAQRKRLCISDFYRGIDSGEKDVVAFHCVTVGPKASEITQKLFADDEYQEYLYLHGLSVESAEGLAEYWHKRIRQELGFDGEDSPRIKDLFTQHYRGSRYSFGYPACPEMSDQEKLFRLLEPERIGCHLTENWQIDPEQSTSAIVVHHPEAKYFNV